VRAVDRLPVELREVVLLRWFEGLAPRRIAAELGLPLSTVWNRLRQALQRLRERLDQEHGGDHRAWLLPLLPVLPVLPARAPAPAGHAAPALPSLLAGVSIMTTKTKAALAFAVLLLLAGGYAWWPVANTDAAAPPSGIDPALAGAHAAAPAAK